jgi:hypothetical protein
VPHQGFQTCARRNVLEDIEAELVEEQRHGDMRVVRHGVAQRQRPICGQLNEEPVRERLDDVVIIVLGIRLAADGDDGPLRRRGHRRRAIGIVSFGACTYFAVDGDWNLVLGPDISAIDRQAAVVVDTDEDACARNLDRIVDDRPVVEGRQRRFDLAEPLINLVW